MGSNLNRVEVRLHFGERCERGVELTLVVPGSGPTRHHGFSGSPRIQSDDRCATGHGLHGHHAEIFAPRKEKSPCTLEQPPQLIIIDPAEELDRVPPGCALETLRSLSSTYHLQRSKAGGRERHEVLWALVRVQLTHVDEVSLPCAQRVEHEEIRVDRRIDDLGFPSVMGPDPIPDIA